MIIPAAPAVMIPKVAQPKYLSNGEFTRLPSNHEFPIWASVSRIVCSSCPGHNEFPTRASPSGISAAPTARFCPSDGPRLLPRNRFLRHCSNPPPSAPDFATAIGVLPARQRQRIDPPQHLAKEASMQMPAGKQQPIIAGMLASRPPVLDQPLLQASPRPGVDSLRQHDPTPQVAQVVGQQAQL